MKKLTALMFVGMFVLSLSFASAMTSISGAIYNSGYTERIGGANVTITCDSNGTISTQYTVSLADGSYIVGFDEPEESKTGVNICGDGDILTVYAEKGALTGINSGNINNDSMGTWDVGVVNVALVPEFGTVVGILTMISAIGIFFVVRKE